MKLKWSFEFENVSVAFCNYLILFWFKIFNVYKTYTGTFIKVIESCIFFLSLVILIDYAWVLDAESAIIGQLTGSCNIIWQKHETVLGMEEIVKFMVICKLFFSGLKFLQKHLETVVRSDILPHFVRYIILLGLFIRHWPALRKGLAHTVDVFQVSAENKFVRNRFRNLFCFWEFLCSEEVFGNELIDLFGLSR